MWKFLPTTTLERAKLRVVHLSKDTACLVGSLLGRRELFEAGFDLRREVCAEMVRRREDIEPFIPGVFDAYVSNMSLEGIWGGESIMCLRRGHHNQQPQLSTAQGKASPKTSRPWGMLCVVHVLAVPGCF